MPDKVAVTVDLTKQEYERIEFLAHEQGYKVIGEYLLSLAADEQTQDELAEEFRQGWQAAKNGQTIPASDLCHTLKRGD